MPAMPPPRPPIVALVRCFRWEPAPSSGGARRPSFSPCAGLVLLVLAACGEGRSAQPGPTVRDSAGVTIVENPAPEDGPALLTSERPLVEIGVVEGEPEYQFARVTGAARLSDGRIVVSDAPSGSIRWYDAEGRHLTSFGRPGQGPEEFGYVSGVVPLPGDSVLVQDRWNRVWLDPEGAFVRRETFDRGRWAELWQPNFSEGFEWLGDGTLFAPVYVRDAAQQAGQRPTPGPPFRPRMILVRAAGDLSTVDTLGAFGGIEQQYVEVGGRFGVRAFVPPYPTNTTWSAGVDGTLVIGDSQYPEVHVFGPDGTHRIVRWAAEPEPVTQAELEAWKEMWRGSPGVELAELERGWAQMEVPDHKPHYFRADPTRDGSVWVQIGDPTSTTARWIVFGADGLYRGTVTLPGPFQIRDAGSDYVLGVYRDATEVEFVRMYGIGDG
jgi:hypothetical protein